MSMDNNVPPVVKTLSIKVIGVGGAGGNAVDHLATSGLPGVSFAVAHTNERMLAQSATSQKALLGLKLMRGLGTGGDPDLGRAAAEEDVPVLKAMCEGVDLVFIVGGLGGGTATGVAPVLARVAKESGALVLGVMTLPFEFEGARRARQAQLGLQQLKAAADGVVSLPHQKIVKLLDEKTSLIETFHFSNELLAQGVRGIWQMLTRRGLINVDFADLCAVLRGRHAESSFATAEAEGDDRAREVMDKLFANPLLGGGHMLGEADAVLVSLVGGLDLTMTDVCHVMEQINRQAESAQLVVGAAIEDEYQKRLSVTLVVSRRNDSEPETPSRSERLGMRNPRVNDATSAEEAQPNFLSGPAAQRSGTRGMQPGSEMTGGNKDALFSEPKTASKRSRKSVSRWRQGQLPLESHSKGRFEKSEPTIYQGEDLDLPTYIRRGIALN